MITCVRCDEELTWDRKKGWVHQGGHPYKGRCLCPGQPHTYSHDPGGKLLCRTWRDHHVARPKGSPQAC